MFIFSAGLVQFLVLEQIYKLQTPAIQIWIRTQTCHTHMMEERIPMPVPAVYLAIIILLLPTMKFTHLHLFQVHRSINSKMIDFN